MTKLEAEIVLLKDALVQAQYTVEFLHNCLVNPDNGEFKGGFYYAYPEQTLKYLEEWEELALPLESCFHSINKVSCSACCERVKHQKELYQARKIMENDCV